MESRSRTPTPIIVGEARKESRGYLSDSVGKRGARLPYVPGLPFGMAAILRIAAVHRAVFEGPPAQARGRVLILERFLSA
jgi:hypothetical protein